MKRSALAFACSLAILVAACGDGAIDAPAADVDAASGDVLDGASANDTSDAATTGDVADTSVPNDVLGDAGGDVLDDTAVNDDVTNDTGTPNDTDTPNDVYEDTAAPDTSPVDTGAPDTYVPPPMCPAGAVDPNPGPASWTQTPRGLGTYIMPLTSGRPYGDVTDMASIDTSRWATRQELLDSIENHHSMLVAWANKQTVGPIQQARVFNAVVPIWIFMRRATLNDLAPGGGQFPADLMDRIRQKGAVALINLGPENSNNFLSIRDGSYDEYLVALGEQIGLWTCNANSAGNSDKGWAKDSRVVVRLGPEVNGNWHTNAWGTYLPANWMNAHRRVADMLRQGLANVGAPAWRIKFMVHFLQKGADNLSHMNDYYPGAGYVDIFGLSVYDRAGDTTPALLADVDEEVSWFRSKQANAHVWLAEVGTHYDGSNNIARGNWVRDGYNGIYNDMTVNRRVKVFLYSHYIDSSDKDWRCRGLNYDPSSSNNSSLRARYGLFTTLDKFRSSNVFAY